ncbi:unnamed protein product [Symbiodinium sp. CCMP2592]|nr:unnamed protein product [Symbiodinium sp. CCMP2592]
MSAAVLGQLLSACAGAYSAASSAVWWAASLPPTCKESMTHTALTCSGATPRYFTPAFGPLALAWGWLLVGVLLGFLFRRAVCAIVGLAGGRPSQCPSPRTPWSWEALLRELSARNQDPHRHEVLQNLLQGCEAALEELCRASQRTPASLMAHLVANHSEVADAAALRPPTLAPRRRRVGEAAHPGPPCESDVSGRREGLYVPLLHAGAGNLSERALQAWRVTPDFGPRFSELAAKLRGAAPVAPGQLARSLLALWRIAKPTMPSEAWQRRIALASVLTALPDAPLPLQAAIVLCMGPDGYLTAAAQSALLESDAGAIAAAATRALADDVRATHGTDPARRSPTTRRGLRRARRRTAPCDSARTEERERRGRWWSAYLPIEC